MQIRAKIFFALLAAGVCAVGFATFSPNLASADDAPGGVKNLKVLPSTMTRQEVKAVMKQISAALGVECDHCHKEGDFAADTEKKDIARGMMKMAAAINTQYFDGKMRVGCITCHNGNAEPKGPMKK